MSERKPVDQAAIKIPLPVLADVLAVYGKVPRLDCQGKCQEYCCPVGDTVTAVERDRMAKAAGYEPNGLDWRNPEARCNMLGADGRCTVYAVRPIICRIWGVTDDMRCPHGCKPVAYLAPGAAVAMVRGVRKADKEYKGTT
jgi:Fe-S-cluster containining protein